MSQTWRRFYFNLNSAVGNERRNYKPRMHTDKHGIYTARFTHPPGEPFFLNAWYLGPSVIELRFIGLSW